MDGVSATEGFDIPSAELCAGRGLSFSHITALPERMKRQYTNKVTPHFWTTFRLTYCQYKFIFVIAMNSFFVPLYGGAFTIAYTLYS